MQAQDKEYFSSKWIQTFLSIFNWKSRVEQANATFQDISDHSQQIRVPQAVQTQILLHFFFKKMTERIFLQNNSGRPEFQCRVRFFCVLSSLQHLISHQVDIFSFSDSQINQSLFEELARSNWSLHNFRFASCEIGEKMAYFLRFIDYKNLKSLDITSERISSKGIKDLAQLDLRLLQNFWIDNTNMTVDSMKLFQKMKYRLYIFGVRSQTNLAACLAFKEARGIMIQSSCAVIGINPCLFTFLTW